MSGTSNSGYFVCLLWKGCLNGSLVSNSTWRLTSIYPHFPGSFFVPASLLSSGPGSLCLKHHSSLLHGDKYTLIIVVNLQQSRHTDEREKRCNNDIGDASQENRFAQSTSAKLHWTPFWGNHTFNHGTLQNTLLFNTTSTEKEQDTWAKADLFYFILF